LAAHRLPEVLKGLVADAAAVEPVSIANSLVSGKRTGMSAEKRSDPSQHLVESRYNSEGYVEIP
jgi:hypothetical protein